MLLYVTTDEGKERKVRPLHTIPDTVAQLYDLGQREHDRSALLLQPEGAGWAETPDWRFDREVIRIALYWRERLHATAGQRVAIFGPLSQLWIAADFAALSMGAVAVGLSHTLGDDAVVAALNETGARVAFATDAASAARLIRLRPRIAGLEAVIGPDGSPEDKALVPLARFFELANTLDTAERAAKFREDARAIAPDSPGCWHYAPGVPEEGVRVVKLTHRETMARVRAYLKRVPAQPRDIAYLEGDAVTLETRFAWYAFAGDGYTTIALGRAGRALEDVAGLKPARILGSAGLLDQLWRQVDATPAGEIEGVSRRVPGLGWLHARARDLRIRRGLRERAGDRLRWIEPLGALSPELKGSLSRVVGILEWAGPIPVSGSRPDGGPERGAEARTRQEANEAS